MILVLIIAAIIWAFLSSGKYKGLIRIWVTGILAMFYFFILVFFYLIISRI